MNDTYSSSYQTVSSMLYKVFGWMMFALLVSAGTAYYVASNTLILETLFRNSFLLFFIFLLQLVLVVILSAFVMKINFLTALICFTCYAVLTGLTLSSIFLVYTQQSIFISFVVAAGMFGSMALFGYFTKADLSSMGSIASMGLLGLIIGFLINLFLKNGTFDYVLSFIGVAVFTVLTAYDMQKIKNMSANMSSHGEIANKISLSCALALYLDFINLFLMLLRIFGRRNND